MQKKCLETWQELNSRLPLNGTDNNTIEGNWSCWTNGRHIMGANGMDCWPVVEYVMKTVRPKRILEIGFNVGHSSIMWLSHDTVEKLVSVDIKTQGPTITGKDFVKEKYGDRFDFINVNSMLLKDIVAGQQFDLVVVDGGHDEAVCINDIEIAKLVKAPFVIVDDMIVMSSVKSGVDKYRQMNPGFKQMKLWNVAWGVSLYYFD